ncbi:MAG: YjjG family noncanonical pyrimidine nucleotidase [Muribaculaceae bacterium]|nr:YjjG family noncanonical pyrimidine nucleotidase [Muribaculaceae bacterium]
MVENKSSLTRDLLEGIKIVWLDLDDTIWDFHANSRVALRGLYDDYSLSCAFPTAEQWIDCYERHNHALWDLYNRAQIEKVYLMKERFLRPLTEVGHPKAEELAARFDKEYLDRLAECTELISGAISLLTKIKEHGLLTGILSNGFVEVQHRKIRNSGLAPLIDYIVLSDDIGVNKPDGRIFRYAESVAGVTADQCLMIGDNPVTDIAGALNAGWRAILFSRNGDTATSLPAPVATTLDSLSEIF